MLSLLWTPWLNLPLHSFNTIPAMKVATFIKCLIKLKVVGVWLDKNVNLEKKLLDCLFLAHILINISLLIFYAWLNMYSLSKRGSYELLLHGMLMLYNSVIIVNPSLSTIILVHLRSLDLFGNARISPVHVLYAVFNSALTTAAFAIGIRNFFGHRLYNDILLGVMLVWTSLHLFILILLSLSVIHGFKVGCLNPTVERINYPNLEILAKKYSQMKAGLSVFALMNTAYTQIMIICSIYTMLVSVEIMSCFLLTLALITQTIMIIKGMDGIYQDMEKLIQKGRKEALFASQMVKDQLNHILDELAASGPLTGLGFMNMDRTLITSMLSTTLTYIIALISLQSVFNPNASK